MHGLPAALGVVLVFKPVLYNLKLELPHGANDLAPVELVDEKLGHTLVHQLVDAFLKLLRLHRVGILYVLEHLGREARQASEMQLLAVGQRVANLEYAVVGQSYDVSRVCLVDGALALRHELRGRREAHRLAQPDVQVRLVAHKLSAAHLAEGYA